jgi:AGZA family xanthine/uracil permease-like MFS transporter
MAMLERYFRLSEHGTTVRTELLAGLTTFLTMAYIIFVQPAVLSGAMFGFETGMDFGAVTTATCLAAALASVIMALYGHYPIALAPGMGENFFFVFSVIPSAAAAGSPAPWKAAMGVVFVSGVLFYVVYLTGVRETLFSAISPSMKNGIAAGIGLFIAFIGLQNAGIVIKDPGTLVKLNSRFASPDTVVFATGLLTAAALHSRRVRGSLLLGILCATLMAVGLRLWLPCVSRAPLVTESKLFTMFALERLARGPVSLPPSLAPTFLQMDLAHALSLTMWPFIVIFLFMDTFDTVGTLIGVGEQAGFIRDNQLPRAREAMLADQAGTIIGACLGAGTTTSYIESAAGVEAGGRTGLTGLTVAALFLLALFFSPLIAVVGSHPPITAAALVIVGSMMMKNAAKIAWEDYSECIPAFLTTIGIPLTYSIGDGLALGFLSYPLVKLLGGKGREVSAFMYVMAAILLAYFVFVRVRIS